MANPLPLISFISSILFIILFIYPSLSTASRRILHDHPSKLQHRRDETSFRVALKHVDSGKNLTKFERLQRGVMRGNLRLERLMNNMMMATTAADSTSQVISPVHAGNGEFLMNLAIGTPPETYSAIMDTGSDLIWTQCKPCTKCFDAPTPIFDPRKSSTFSKVSCSDSLCKALPTSDCESDGCEYLYSYGDYSSTQGVLATETFTFDDKVPVSGLGFGCGQDNEGSGFSQGGGLVGLGRGPLSLVSQLKQSKFSYCLTSINDDTSSSENSKTSLLVMGSLNSDHIPSNTTIFTTPLIKNPSQPSFYYLSLIGISVGNVDLSIKNSTFAINSDGSGGMIVDSGTTITYLEESAFDMVKKEFISQTKLSVDNSDSTGLDLCFELPTANDDDDQISIEIPKLVFHFDGASLDLPGENYMIGDMKSGVACLAMGSSSGISIFGNIQQQNMMVVHDLEKEALSFIPTKCDQL